MRKMTIKSLSARDCKAVVKALNGKTRYKLQVSYEQYSDRKYQLNIVTDVDYNVAQIRFDDEVVTALIRALRKAMTKCGQSFGDDEE